MPWLSIIIAILSMLTAKKQGASTGAALAVGALAGAGTYYVTHETEWGVNNLGQYDGVVSPAPGPTVAVPAPTPANPSATINIPAPNNPNTNSGQSGFWDVLSDWGPTGTAAVIGTTAVATNSNLSKYIPLILGVGAIILLKG